MRLTGTRSGARRTRQHRARGGSHQRPAVTAGRGFTLVEVLVALVVLAVGMLGLAALLVEGLQGSRSALEHTQAVNLAADIAERMRANRAAARAYDTAAGTPEPRIDAACEDAAGPCDPRARAGHDLRRWLDAAAGLKVYHRHALVASSHSSALVFVGEADGLTPGDYAQADPPDAPPLADTRRLLVHAYSVSADSSEGAGYPSLRRKRLVAGPAVQDEEIIPGIEDLRARYGVDVDRDGSADRYLDAHDLDAGMAVVSARVWLRVRAAERDPAWQDTSRYAYANQDERVPAAERPFRRLVISRTIYLRNARGS